MYEVAPFGERRADFRMAVCTANLMQAQSVSEITEEDFSEMVSALANYLPTSEVDDEEADLQALKAIQQE